MGRAKLKIVLTLLVSFGASQSFSQIIGQEANFKKLKICQKYKCDSPLIQHEQNNGLSYGYTLYLSKKARVYLRFFTEKNIIVSLSLVSVFGDDLKGKDKLINDNFFLEIANQETKNYFTMKDFNYFMSKSKMTTVTFDDFTIDFRHFGGYVMRIIPKQY